jgi:hypothetical protein
MLMTLMEVRVLRTEVADRLEHAERANAGRHAALMNQLQAVARHVRA